MARILPPENVTLVSRASQVVGDYTNPILQPWAERHGGLARISSKGLSERRNRRTIEIALVQILGGSGNSNQRGGWMYGSFLKTS
jgi:hypothetical protein